MKQDNLKTMEWISVQDRLPDFEKDVLLYWKWYSETKEYESIEVGYLTEVTTRKTSNCIVSYPEFRTRDNYSNQSPTHWMPLPEPPKP